MPRTLKQVAVDMATAFTKWNLWQGGGASALSELDDVNITNPEADEALVYNGSEWINSVIAGGNLGARLTLIGTLNPGDNPALSVDDYDILICVTLNGAYIKGSATFKRTEFMNSTRVEYSIGNNESVWIYPASWNCDEGSAYMTNVYGLKFAPIEPIEEIALNDLSNVSIASPVNGNALLFDGSTWKNGNVPAPTLPTYDDTKVVYSGYATIDNGSYLYGRNQHINAIITTINYLAAGEWFTIAYVPTIPKKTVIIPVKIRRYITGGNYTMFDAFARITTGRAIDLNMKSYDLQNLSPNASIEVLIDSNYLTV